MLSGANVTLLIGGSIAAYKAAELARELVRGGAKVNAVLSRSACEFITPLTLQSLTGNPAASDLFDLRTEADIGHIKLADSADVVLVAPATADCLAKAAAGIADDLSTTILLATKAPIVFAPAMNVNMWENEITQRNVQTLKDAGIHFVDPEEGELACGWQGKGRFAETDRIVESLNFVLTKKDLSGSRVLVTAGPTREFIDPIRFVSNRSTGRMGFALARVSRWRGADVTLVTGPSELQDPCGVKTVRVTTANEMRDAVLEEVRQPDAGIHKSQFVFMAAAVTDHRPSEISLTKVKQDKSSSYDLTMEPCPDILQELGESRAAIEESSGLGLKLIGFSAETGEEELIGWARDKLERKNADMMVGNFADEGFASDTNRVWLLERGGRSEEVSTADKHLVAGRILRAALRVS